MKSPYTSKAGRLVYLPVVIVSLLFLFTNTAPVHAAQETFRHFTVFPVARYVTPRADNTGNNNYYAMTRGRDPSRLLVASSGSEDLLVYSGNSFTVRRRRDLIYYQSIDWLPESRSALLVGSKTPPDTGGTLVKYNPANHSLREVRSVDPNLMGVSVNSRNEALIVGGSILPNHRSAIYRFRNDQLDGLRLRKGPVFHDVEWHPVQQKALLVGEGGTVLSWTEADTFVEHDLPQQQLLKTVAWHPRGNKALIGGINGLLYLFENGDLTRITTDISWGIQDIEWHPNENFAVIVGGIGKNDRGYWGIYRQFQIADERVSNPLFSANWIDQDNLLMGGQKVLYRVSRNHRPEDFGLTASLSVSNPNPDVSETIDLSGYGSTYRANADSVTAYRFRYGTGDSTPWTNNPNHRIEYLGPGRYNPVLEVRSSHTEDIQRTSVTIRVEEKRKGGLFHGIDFFYWLTLVIFLASLTVAYATLRA